ncbi:MAG: SIMPL domain-containing protein [bacterium]|nr:SIMPL domain-containing protein [bacterium]
MRQMQSVALVLLLAGWANPGIAQWNEHPPLEMRDRVMLSAGAQTTVQNDLMTALLTVQASATEFAIAADEANRLADWTFEQAAAFDGVSARTANYQTWERAPRDQPKEFGVTQQVLVTSSDSGALTGLLAILQSRLRVQSVGYSPSLEQREEAVKQMTEAALKAFRVQADSIRATLGFAGYEIVQLRVGASVTDPADAARHGRLGTNSFSDGGVRAPTLKGGTSIVNGSATGTIQLVH